MRLREQNIPILSLRSQVTSDQLTLKTNDMIEHERLLVTDNFQGIPVVNDFQNFHQSADAFHKKELNCQSIEYDGNDVSLIHSQDIMNQMSIDHSRLRSACSPENCITSNSSDLVEPNILYGSCKFVSYHEDKLLESLIFMDYSDDIPTASDLCALFQLSEDRMHSHD